MENLNQNLPPAPTQEPPVSKKWYQHKGIIAVISLTVIAGVVVFFYFKQVNKCYSPDPRNPKCTPIWETPIPKNFTQPQPIQNQVQAQTQTSGWQTYKNEKYGFEFQYPTGWSVTNADTGVKISKENTYENQYGEVSSQTTNLTVREMFYNDPQEAILVEQQTQDINKNSNYTINGVKAIKKVEADRDLFYSANIIFVLNEKAMSMDYSWSFGGVYETADFVKNSTRAADLEAIEKIIKSLKFVK